ncbi:hypothetical protein OPQ81_010404 [Rhizoctonia solani]|nr:hypothetical protein OPQ81_010404 [Rhizoctonia solani]
MPWASDAPAIAHAWYQGQENGNALADVLFGRVNPSAASTRLPTAKGVLVGYKWFDTHDIEPMWPFGYGLSYTSFAVSNVDAVVDDLPHQHVGHNIAAALIRATVSNTGAVEGSETLQVYLSSPSAVEAHSHCPTRALVAFAKVRLAPRESKTVEVTIDRASLRTFDTTAINHQGGKGAWTIPPGVYTCHVGTSSRHIVAKVPFTIG